MSGLQANPPLPHTLGVDRPTEDLNGRICTLSGRWMAMPPDPADIDIRDIAAGLAKLCRYAGQIPNGTFYSVAQHSVLVSRQFDWPYERMTALLHDAEEAYLGDMPSPWKSKFPELVAMGDRLRLAIIDKYSIAFNPEDGLSEAIHEADDRIYRWERRRFWGESDVPIWPWDHVTAECEFLREFDRINQAIERLKDGR